LLELFAGHDANIQNGIHDLLTSFKIWLIQ
jgi:hypothetical protein